MATGSIERFFGLLLDGNGFAILATALFVLAFLIGVMRLSEPKDTPLETSSSTVNNSPPRCWALSLALMVFGSGLAWALTGQHIG
ncbi:MAG: hypothetical protein AAFR21_10950 [Pseudomonadota bacterium]